MEYMPVRAGIVCLLRDCGWGDLNSGIRYFKHAPPEF